MSQLKLFLKRESGCCPVDDYSTTTLISISESISYITYLFLEWRIGLRVCRRKNLNTKLQFMPFMAYIRLNFENLLVGYQPVNLIQLRKSHAEAGKFIR